MLVTIVEIQWWQTLEKRKDILTSIFQKFLFGVENVKNYIST